VKPNCSRQRNVHHCHAAAGFGLDVQGKTSWT
jgi:hypothetical protein